MSRYYKRVPKNFFLESVEALMDGEDYPYELPKAIEKDLSKVEFDFENYTSFDDEEGFGSYPIGYEEIAPGFHIFWCGAGGDWEIPVCYILYFGEDGLRAYIPKDGNLWDKKNKCALEGDDESKSDTDLMRQDILKRITSKKQK